MRLWVGVPSASSALAEPLPEESIEPTDPEGPAYLAFAHATRPFCGWLLTAPPRALFHALVAVIPHPHRCRANLAHVSQSRPDSGLGFQVNVLEIVQVVPSSLGRASSRSGRRCLAIRGDTHWSWGISAAQKLKFESLPPLNGRCEPPSRPAATSWRYALNL